MTQIESESINLNKPLTDVQRVAVSAISRTDREATRAHCSKCGSREAVRAAAASTSAPTPTARPYSKFAGQLLVVAIVEVEEGPQLVTHLVDRNPEKIEVGAAVEVRFEAIEDSDVSLPVFILLT